MTRLRFLLISLLSGAATCLGFNREALSRRWLKANGFQFDHTAHNGRHRVIIALVGDHYCAGGVARYYRDPPATPAWSYMQWLKDRNFELLDYHSTWEFETLYGVSWNDVKLKETELAPPTVHRFPRPWWI